MNTGNYARIYLSPQFGDLTTPWPPWTATNKEDTLFFQIKGAASQPVLSLQASYDVQAASTVNSTLNISVSIKPTNAGAIQNLVTVSGLAQNTRHDIVVDFLPDWTSAGYVGIWVNGALVGTRNNNTLMSDLTDTVSPMIGIYRYNYSAKAPNDCAITFHLAGVKYGTSPLS